jgi:hypothetical protein
VRDSPHAEVLKKAALPYSGVRLVCEFECIFETTEKSTSNTVTEDKAAEIAADFTTTFYHV